jgi:DNA-binding MarR family transcriptional regulator
LDNLNVYGFEMARVSEVYLSTLSNIMKPHGLERYFLPMMHLCEHSGKITQKELGLALRKDKVSTMRIVDYLSEKGLLRRQQDCNDRRCQILEVTNKAMKLLPKIKEGIQQTNALLFQNFSKSERDQFKKSMDKLYKTIGEMPDPEFVIEAKKRKNI